MREQKKVLRLKKFKVAKLNSNYIIGGTGDPVNNTDTTTGTHQQTETQQDYYCPSVPQITCTTISEVRTELKNGCTDGFDNATQLGNPTEQNCP